MSRNQGSSERWGVVACMALLSLVLALPVLAQLPVGTILGVVKDSSGAVIPDATVTIRNTDTGQTRTATTGNDGAYRVPALAVGHYDVRAEHAGFQTVVQQGLTLNVSEEIVVNAELKIGTTQQEVMVTGEAPLVNTTSSVLGGLVNETKLANLPLNGRNYADLALLQTGIAEDRNEDSEGVGGNSGTWYSSNGAPPRSNNYILDGAQLSNLFGGNSSGGSGTTLGVDGIQEYKLLTNSFSAEYGQTMGSQMVMVSKGGTNQWHGDGFEYFRNSGLDARNYFDYGYLTPGQPRLPTFQRNNFGGAFGGPIQKDKTFFYAVYEGLRLHYGTTALTPTIPQSCFDQVKAHPAIVDAGATLANPGPCTGTTSAAGVPVTPVMIPLLSVFNPPNLPGDNFTFAFNSPTSVNWGQIRVDHTFSAKDSAFFRYTIDQNTELITSGGTQASAGASFPNFLSSTPGKDQFGTLAENHVFSQTLLNTIRLSASRTNQLSANAYGSQGPLSGPQYSFTKTPGGVYFPIGDINVGNITIGSDTQLPNSDIQNIYTLSDDLYYTKGRHALKFGLLLDRYELGLGVGAAAIGSITFNDVESFLRGIPASYLSLSPTSNTNRHYVFETVGMYAQDDFRATSRLTLNLGLRYEFYTTPNELNGRGRNFNNFATAANPPAPSDLTSSLINNSSLRNFEPRVGFAWDVTGKGKTSLRGAFGEYYDIANIGSLFQQSAQGTPPISVRNTFNPTDLNIGGASQTQYLSMAPLLSYPAAGSAGLRVVEYHTAAPHVLQYNLTLDQELPKGLALTVSYVGSRGIDLWYTSQRNPFAPTAFTSSGGPIFQPYLCAGVPSVVTTSGCVANPAFHRLNPGYGSGTLSATGSESWYNSLQVSLVKRLSRGLEFQAAYTYSRSLDTTSGQMSGGDCRSAGMDGVTWSGNLLVEKGPSCSDLTHNLHFNLLYHFPNSKMDNFAGKLMNGWWVGNIITLESGLPFNPLLKNLRSQGGSGADRPMQNTAAWIAANPCTSQPGQTPVGVNPCAYTPIPFDSKTVITGDPNNWFNTAMFSLQPVGQLGTVTRGMLRGPGLGDWDFSLAKDTALHAMGERGSVQFRAEIFNITNHPNFGQIPVNSGYAYTGSNGHAGPFSELPRSGSGQISSTSTTSRQVQLALKIIF